MAGRPGHFPIGRLVVKKLMMFVCALAIAATAFAAPGKVKARYTGTVEKYDATTHTLTIKNKDKQAVFVINDQSQVLAGGTKADPSAFAAGKKIKVEFVMDGANKIAQKVEVAK
jgi:hypothetical protein